MGRLDGKVALITGGARGMGKSHVRHFAAKGASSVSKRYGYLVEPQRVISWDHAKLVTG